ncbi:restriction endonuclease [Clostridium estertheticum]|uniref:restriction endonuclease n=1 Tax=Clostridium estertheticum TaxID=238834 RepID=UPI001C0B5DB8|nr:restriction endonuclease [Clostridium estertheticum]MBU3072536.1 restriction endonuclease [Clostridium estertheticum]MBU3162629.1 restriction endonuclease [Clostridium estertheticum]
MEQLYYVYLLFVICSLFAAIDLYKDNANIKKYKNMNANDTKHNLNSEKHYIKECLIGMDGREFEKFCVILFKSTGEYESVNITPYKYDGGKDIILTTKISNEKIYVECKRYTPKATSKEEFMIGREIYQKLIGAMDGEGIHKGIIITTGNVHYNAHEYIKKLELNDDNKKLSIIELDEILNMCNNFSKEELSNMFNCNKGFSYV